ncbi:MMPL family transporter [Crenobacter sp. SG2305]|uniref:MMPL family transporter n=1 Tax=Crenobacter oryzisoli TaxID=3056844 RepID=UPI0025AB4F2B|nr:MMPL family transporter [Crenobacter sp. SG2305]MDN0082726.1 MMPL family transporter [Crenobacter sp. SG2305]
MIQRRGLIVGVWLLALVLGLALLTRARFSADMSAFLPAAPSAEQQILVDQLKDGTVSRLMLVGITGASSDARAELSRRLAARLRTSHDFASVANGEAGGFERERKLLFDNRYLLSPAVTSQRFSTAGLHAAIADSIAALALPSGAWTKALLPADPTGETLQLIDMMSGRDSATISDGVWASRDGKEALLMLYTRAAGSDTDAQEAALARLNSDFAAVRAELLGHYQVLAGARLQATGPGVFGVEARERIRGEALRFSILGSLIIVALLWSVYRSWRVLLLGLVPVASGVLAGVVAVSLGFGMVHAITVGFGVTLIGEAVDYSIYLFIQSGAGGVGSAREWQRRFWPTIRLGVLTSVCGFAALLFSGFPGLAQLGLYSIAGLAAAALVTRWVLPLLLPAGFAVRDLSVLAERLAWGLRCLRRLRALVPVLALLSLALLIVLRQPLWNHDLAALSPVPAEQQRLDAALRAELGAPDVRYLAVVSGADREAVLRETERLAPKLDALVARGLLAGYESPSRYLPSQAAQAARQASLPDETTLRARLATALAGQPIQPAKLEPFVAAVEAARQAPLLSPASFRGTSLALLLDGLLVEQGGRNLALLPLRAPAGGIDAAALSKALSGAPLQLVDLKTASNRLYGAYLDEAIHLVGFGMLAIVLLLALALRSPAKLGRALLPLVTAVLVVTAGHLLVGGTLNLLHLVGLLLIVAIGSNYALFFVGSERSASVLLSLLIANLATLAGFGLLAFSSVPVLAALGSTAGPGALLALLFAAVLDRHEDA